MKRASRSGEPSGKVSASEACGPTDSQAPRPEARPSSAATQGSRRFPGARLPIGESNQRRSQVKLEEARHQGAPTKARPRGAARGAAEGSLSHPNLSGAAGGRGHAGAADAARQRGAAYRGARAGAAREGAATAARPAKARPSRGQSQQGHRGPERRATPRSAGQEAHGRKRMARSAWLKAHGRKPKAGSAWQGAHGGSAWPKAHGSAKRPLRTRRLKKLRGQKLRPEVPEPNRAKPS
jgi:hypothetical protein